VKLRSYLSFALLACLLFLTDHSHAKIISCEAYNGDAKGWIPRSFVIDVSEDRTRVTVVEPKSNVFGAVPFEKGLFGSDLWSRGKGKSKTGEFYNYQFQLILKENDTKAQIQLTMHQYHPLILNFNCREGRGATARESDLFRPQKRVSNAEIARQATNTNLCIYAVRQQDGVTVWDLGKGADDFVREAQKRGLTCGVTAINANSSTDAESQNSDLKSKLLEAKDLFDSGLISEDEYEKLKEKLLGL
jgi:hypothetical protein